MATLLRSSTPLSVNGRNMCGNRGWLGDEMSIRYDSEPRHGFAAALLLLVEVLENGKLGFVVLRRLRPWPDGLAGTAHALHRRVDVGIQPRRGRCQNRRAQQYCLRLPRQQDGA